MAEDITAATARRRAACHARIETPNGGALVAEIPGTSLGGIEFETVAGAGYGALTCDVLGSGPDGRLPYGAACMLFQNWRLLTLRLQIEGYRAWEGRIRDIALEDSLEHPHRGRFCRMKLIGEGFWHDFTRRPAPQNPAYTDDNTEMSAAQLLVELLQFLANDSWWIINTRTDRIAATGPNIAPLSVGPADFCFDLLQQALKAGQSGGDELLFLVYEPELGVVLRERYTGSPLWRLGFFEAGLGVRWSDEGYVSDWNVVYTDKDNNSQQLGWKASDRALSLHNSVRQYGILSLSQVGKTGAESARDSSLALHEDPVTIHTPAHLAPREGQSYPSIGTFTGGHERAYRVRAGDLVEIPDVLPGNTRFIGPGRDRHFLITRTRYVVDTGELEIGFDGRPARLREHEDAKRIARGIRITEPLRTRNLLAQADSGTSSTTITTTANAVQVPVSMFSLEFQLLAATTVVVEFSGEVVHATNSAGGDFKYGFAFDGEDWDSTDRAVRKTANWAGSLSATTPIDGRWSRRLGAGDHVLQLWWHTTTQPLTMSGVHVSVFG